MIKFVNKHYKNIVLCLIGTLINALGVNCFLLGSNLGDGGTVGISLALKYTLGLSPALTSLIINTLVVFIGWKFLSKTTAIYTVIANTSLSFFLNLTENINLGVNDFVINSVFGGAVIGIGAGLVISTGSTLGGSSVIAKVINKYTDMKTSQGIFILDGLIVLSFLLVLPITNVLFTLIMLFVTERATSFIIEGFNPKKAVTIISSKNEIISNKINDFTGRGSTLLTGNGGYSKSEKTMLYVVVPQSQVTRIKKLVNKEDENAFLAIHDVRDVLGSGFININ
ncbi:YitT family protein [Tetragenococcus koreensis]|uniref:YitT family membrane protein n=1 Tax=Tetragenococcus koreensis TaxID=290335 RepID=A0AAN4RK11_9ENTE|nr:YitT family protein [Tetragenococcus koreensis]MDN6751125.1 YitT family protein [Staphylococcus equorum]MCF1585679.1 YitT family protein [Tetragenococcus koreensis]MCF1615312.1 YitT family protein [Tetragenococcus koreensis]MCF1618672.1 YitT family protein [Tetragenococcus koreensis]MCF1625131.1 YitT family protein [Tetragenococcus koreensis]